MHTFTFFFSAIELHFRVNNATLIHRKCRYSYTENIEIYNHLFMWLSYCLKVQIVYMHLKAVTFYVVVYLSQLRTLYYLQLSYVCVSAITVCLSDVYITLPYITRNNCLRTFQKYCVT